VLTIAQVQNGSAGGFAYDPADSLMAIIIGSQVFQLSATMAPAFFATLPLSSSTQPYITYDAAIGDYYATTGTYVYSVTQAGVVKALSGGFVAPSGIAYDPVDGNLYVVDVNIVYRVSPSNGAVTAITPAGAVGGGGGPLGIAYDSADGFLYVADSTNNDIVRLTSSGTISPYAGQCIPFEPPTSGCEWGDADGVGIAAQFRGPQDITYSPETQFLYVADSGNVRIRQIAPGAIVTTLAGNGESAVRDGVGVEAEFSDPAHIANDGTDKNLYVSDELPQSGGAYIRLVGSTGAPPPTPPPTLHGFILYPIPTEDSAPSGITTGGDGNIWFTEGQGAAVGRVTMAGMVTEYKFPSGCIDPEYLAADSSDNVWTSVACKDGIGFAGYIAKVTSAGTITLYAAPNETPWHFTKGPDGNVWFTSYAQGIVSRINPDGSITDFTLEFGGRTGRGNGLTSGPGGNIWIADGQEYLDEVSTLGSPITSYSVPLPSYAITTGPDGNLWITDISSQIARVTPTGSSTLFTLGGEYDPLAIVSGPDGNLWFPEDNYGSIASMSTSGVYNNYFVPVSGSAPFDMTVGPDGNLWFTDGSNAIGRFILNPTTVQGKALRPAAARVRPYYVLFGHPNTPVRPRTIHSHRYEE
jgi:streptogramin lyase